jgi:hypothetical protein
MKHSYPTFHMKEGVYTSMPPTFCKVPEEDGKAEEPLSTTEH